MWMDVVACPIAMNWQPAPSTAPFVCYVEDTSDPVFSIAAAGSLINEVYIIYLSTHTDLNKTVSRELML